MKKQRQWQSLQPETSRVLQRPSGRQGEYFRSGRWEQGLDVSCRQSRRSSRGRLLRPGERPASSAWFLKSQALHSLASDSHCSMRLSRRWASRQKSKGPFKRPKLNARLSQVLLLDLGLNSRFDRVQFCVKFCVQSRFLWLHVAAFGLCFCMAALPCLPLLFLLMP